MFVIKKILGSGQIAYFIGVDREWEWDFRVQVVSKCFHAMIFTNEEMLNTTLKALKESGHEVESVKL